MAIAPEKDMQADDSLIVEAGDRVLERSNAAGVFYLLALIVILAVDARLQSSPAVAGAWIALFVLVFVARLFLHRVQVLRVMYPSLPYRLTVVVSGLCWSGFLIWGMIKVDGLDATGALIIIIAAVFPAGAAYSMYPVRSLMTWHIAALSVPWIIASPIVIPGVHGWAIAIVAPVYIAYLWSNGKRHNELYWSYVTDNRQLAEQGKELSGLADRRLNLLAQLSHEVRTPLNGIVGMIQVFSRSPLSVDQQRMLRTISQSSDILVRLTNDLLEMTRVNELSIEIQNESVDLGQVMIEAAELARPLCRDKGLTLNLITDNEFPSRVVLDKVRLLQVLTNLTTNAAKYSKQGSVDLCVEKLESGHARFSVRDHGIGIPGKELQEIFEPFHQVENFHADERGLGLGLAISKSLVELMGGELKVESVLGEGAEFWFDLPIVKSLDVPEEGVNPSAATQKLPSLERLPEDFKVLVAEDNHVNSEVATAMLKELGIEVHTALNGSAAIEKWKSTRFDLVLMDCNMPGVDGFEATRQIRAIEAQAQRSGTTIIALTAHVFPEVIASCRKAGMNGHLSKPVNLNLLRQAVMKVSMIESSTPGVWLT